MLAPSVIIGALAVVLMNLRSPTHVQLRLTTDHLVLHVAGQDETQMLDSVAFRSLTVRHFARFELSPEQGSIADVAAFSDSNDAPESAWKALPLSPPVALVARSSSLQPSITVEAADHNASAAGVLDRLWVKPATHVVLDVAGSAVTILSIVFAGRSTPAVLSLKDPFELFSTYAQVTGVANLPANSDVLALRFHLPASSPQAQVMPLDGALELIVTLAKAKQPVLFSSEGIPVDAIDLTRQGAIGSVESTLVSNGEITYPDNPKLEKVFLNAHEFLVLGNLQRFRVKEVTLSPSAHALQLIADGIAGNLRAGTPGFGRDYRVSYFDRIWGDPNLVILFGIICWVFPTTVSGYKLYRKLMK